MEKLRPALLPGEQAQEAVLGTSHILPNLVAAVGFLVFASLQYTSLRDHGHGLPNPWAFVLPVWPAVLLVATSRRVGLVATDRRIVLFRVTTFSSRPTGILLEGPRTDVTVTPGSASILFSTFPLTVATSGGNAEKLFVPQWTRGSATRIAEVARTPPPPPAPVLPS